MFSFFDQNPISQLGLIVTRNKTAEKICDLVGNPKKFLDKLHTLKEKICQTEPSIQNSLELCMSTFKLKLTNNTNNTLTILIVKQAYSKSFEQRDLDDHGQLDHMRSRRHILHSG